LVGPAGHSVDQLSPVFYTPAFPPPKVGQNKWSQKKSINWQGKSN